MNHRKIELTVLPERTDPDHALTRPSASGYRPNLLGRHGDLHQPSISVSSSSDSLSSHSLTTPFICTLRRSSIDIVGVDLGIKGGQDRQVCAIEVLMADSPAPHVAQREPREFDPDQLVVLVVVVVAAGLTWRGEPEAFGNVSRVLGDPGALLAHLGRARLRDLQRLRGGEGRPFACRSW